MLKKTTSLISYRLSRRKSIYFSFLFFSFLWLSFYTIPHNPIRDERCLKPIPVEGDYLSNIDYYESPDTHIHPSTWDSLPLKGAFYMLVRNEDLQAARTAMRSLEERFNYAKGYPWILLNPQSFTSDFKRYARRVTQSKVYFGRIDLDAWVPPYWIDIEMAERLMMGLYKRKVPNAMSMSFHQEVRYQAGLFHYHSLFDHVDYVWRVEPGSSYSCNIMDDDPFVEMKTLNKTLGFILTGPQDGNATNNLWKASTHFIKENRELVLPRNDTIMPWIIDEKDKPITSQCHIWSNFELVDLSFFKTESYRRFFHFLDLIGGFFYERWTDGDVRTLAAAMFLKKDQLHFFNNIGYSQGPFSRCPLNANLIEKCSCDYKNSDDFKLKGCTLDLLEIIDSTVVDGMIDFATSVQLKRENEKIK